jgi:hypothetical protein
VVLFFTNLLPPVQDPVVGECTECESVLHESEYDPTSEEWRECIEEGRFCLDSSTGNCERLDCEFCNPHDLQLEFPEDYVVKNHRRYAELVKEHTSTVEEPNDEEEVCAHSRCALCVCVCGWWRVVCSRSMFLSVVLVLRLTHPALAAAGAGQGA